MEFLYKLSGRENHSQMKNIADQVKNLIQRYLVGLIIESSLVATLESTALFILGIQYALLLGVIGGLLNLIPYIGAIISAILPMLMALLTKDSPGHPCM
jgi:predicted PurR-regulated permease PerM